MTTTQLIIVAALFLVTLVSGVGVTRTGKPRNAWLFNLHKLIALATVVLIVVNVIPLLKELDPNQPIIWIFGILSALIFIALFVSGALLSLEKPAAVIVLRVHQVAPLLAVILSALTVYMLMCG